MLFVLVFGMWASSLGMVGLASNLRPYGFVSQEVRATLDPELEIFHAKNNLLNEGVRVWMFMQDQPHERFFFSREAASSRERPLAPSHGGTPFNRLGADRRVILSPLLSNYSERAKDNPRGASSSGPIASSYFRLGGPSESRYRNQI